jgi:hypothetical protein
MQPVSLSFVANIHSENHRNFRGAGEDTAESNRFNIGLSGMIPEAKRGQLMQNSPSQRKTG